jgi:hypothetical protein
LSEKTIYDIPCQQCGHVWQVVLEELERVDQSGYKGIRSARVEQYRARCPKCHFYNILDVLVEEEGGDG